MEYEVVGTIEDAVSKSINTNGADLVFRKGVEVLAVELKNVSNSVNLGTLGYSEKGNDYGGSISRVLRTAERFQNSSIDQLREESQAIQNAGANLRNALYTNAKNVSEKAAEQFDEVYSGMKNNIDKTVPPALATASKFVQSLGTYDVMPFIFPKIIIDPSGPFSPVRQVRD